MYMTKLIFLLVFFSLSAFAEVCSVYFDTINDHKRKLITFVEKDFANDPSIISRFNNMSELQAKNFLETIASHEYPSFVSAIQRLKQNEEHFYRLGEFNHNIFIREIASPGSAAARFERNAAWTSTVNTYSYRVPEFKQGAVVSEFEKDIRGGLVAIRDFLDDPKRVYAEMQDFEDEVMIECFKNDSKYFSRDLNKQHRIRQAAMETVMNRMEESHNFVSTKLGEYAPLVLEDKGYGLTEWFEMLKKGSLFNDSGFLGGKNVTDEALGEYLKQSRNGHGYFTHRIQWYIVMKDMNKFPAKYNNLKGVDMFKMLGDMSFNQKMGQANSSGDTLWQNLFDSFSGSYHQPETFKALHDDYPDLGAWL